MIVRQAKALAPIAEQRIAFAETVERRQQRILDGLLSHPVEPDWNELAKDLEPNHAAQVRVTADFLALVRSEAWRHWVAAPEMHGYCLALWSAKREGIPIVLGVKRFSAAFEDNVIPFRPADVANYWTRRLSLTPDQAAQLLTDLNAFQKSSFLADSEYSVAVMQDVAKLFADAIQQGMTLADFRAAFRERIAIRSRQIIEAIFRTNLQRAYSSERFRQIQQNGGLTPFVQFLGVFDDRQTPLCRSLHGFVSASNDPFWRRFVPPLHWNCRSFLSAIPYTEAIRRGWAQRRPGGGLTFPKGYRPMGNPPDYYMDKQGRFQRVEPQSGFGGLQIAA